MAIDQCRLCPRCCGVVRPDQVGADASDGVCGMPAQPTLARAALHFGEEPCISGTNGSGTVFFSGCSLRCVFCQNEKISRHRYGKTVSVERLIEIMQELEAQGAHNINLVNPTHYAAAIREALTRRKPSIPVVYNTSGYERVETLRLLEGLVDIYLPDCKYVSADLAARFSGAADYPEVVFPALEEMMRQTGPVVLDDKGIAITGTIVRHLVLPGHTHESRLVLEKLAAYGDNLWVSLLFQYTPIGDLSAFKELKRTLTERECVKVFSFMSDLGIANGYVQDRTSQGPEFIPLFDLTGV